MTYYLDFDRTLFDTERFIPGLKERCAALGISLEGDFMKTLEERVVDGTLVFSEGELATFLYDDVLDFLQKKHGAVTIITRGYKAFQEAKIRSALPDMTGLGVIYVGQTLKGEYLAAHIFERGDALAVDDELRELESYALHLPELVLFEMQRAAGGASGKYTVIHSLLELP